MVATLAYRPRAEVDASAGSASRSDPQHRHVRQRGREQGQPLPAHQAVLAGAARASRRVRQPQPDEHVGDGRQRMPATRYARIHTPGVDTWARKSTDQLASSSSASMTRQYRKSRDPADRDRDRPGGQAGGLDDRVAGEQGDDAEARVEPVRRHHRRTPPRRPAPARTGTTSSRAYARTAAAGATLVVARHEAALGAEQQHLGGQVDDLQHQRDLAAAGRGQGADHQHVGDQRDAAGQHLRGEQLHVRLAQLPADPRRRSTRGASCRRLRRAFRLQLTHRAASSRPALAPAGSPAVRWSCGWPARPACRRCWLGVGDDDHPGLASRGHGRCRAVGSALGLVVVLSRRWWR